MATTRDIFEGDLAIAHNGLLEARQSHETHGHPPLTDPGTEFWMKWDEWNPGLMETNQYNQIQQFETSLKPGLEWLLQHSREIGLDPPATSFPKPPPADASYDERQTYLVDNFEVALSIALSKQSDPIAVKRRFVQRSLDQYRLLYQQLKLGNDPATIRLLRIFPGSLTDSPIEAQLFNASLELPGLSYEALSYAWGAVLDPQHLQSIRINGLVQRVTPNLHSALSSLRLPDRSRVLWVDSICINQGDLGERARQIMLMAQIFAKAERTVVYLGPSTTASTALFRFLGLPLCKPSICKDCGVDRTLLEALHDPLTACAIAELEENDVLDGFIDVCHREWWERVWILQEFTLSKQDPTFYCGRDAVSNRLLAKNFYKIYEWVSHRKQHPTRLGACDHFACEEHDLDKDDSHPPTKGPGGENAEITIIKTFKKNEENNPAGGIDYTTDTITEEQETPDDAKPAFPKPIEIPKQSQSGREWLSWGFSAWKASAVLQRRSMCRPWHAPDYLYKSLRAHCSDPHDIVYGVRELLEPTFRVIFKPDYAIPIPKLYTKLSAYMLLFHSWSDMFYYYPYRLSLDSSGLQPTPNTPSWVPNFMIPVEIKDAEKRPSTKVTNSMYDLTGPYILDRVLFTRGVLLDEIVSVFPLPKNNPFKLLQQLWYLERLYGHPSYELLNEDLPSESESKNTFNSFVRETGGISAYPSIAWATRFSEHLPHDISVVHIISKTANFDNVSVAIKRSLDMITICLDQQFENEGKKSGARASREERDEYWKRDSELEDRLRNLMTLLLGKKWLDFIGICTFDFESLRAQVQHQLIPMMAWKPSRLPRGRTSYEEGVNKCDLPFTSAVFQRPVRYSSLLRAIAKDVESDDELKMRRDVVMLLAKAVHDATTPVVGGQREVQYTKLDGRVRSGGGGNEQSDPFDSVPNGIDHSAKHDIGETTKVIVSEFMMTPLPEDVAVGNYLDTPLIGFLASAEGTRGVNRIDSYLEKAQETSNLETMVEGGEEKDSVASDSTQPINNLDEVKGSSSPDNAVTLTYRGKLGGPVLGLWGDTNIKDEQSSTNNRHAKGEGSSRHTVSAYSTSLRPQQATSNSKTKSSDKPVWWCRTEKRGPVNVHILFEELIDFLSGRIFFITETRLLGLTGPGTQDVCDGDDLLLLEGMSFPMIARLEPSKELGNPKKRRRDMSTAGMRREILGTAIIQDIDPKGGNLDEVELPEGFEPLSGFEPEFFTFK